MKKSTNEPMAETAQEPVRKVPLIWEMVTMEGGISLLIIFPLVVLYFFKMAYR